MNDVLTPEDYAALLQLGSDNAALDPMIAQQMEQAKMLREQGQAPQGQMAGRVYVAPNVLQYAAALGNKYKAGQAEDQLKDFQQQQLGNTRKQNEMVMQGILRGNKPAQPPGMTPGFNPYEQLKFPGGSA